MRLIPLVILSTSAVLSLPVLAARPSFDCARATHETEQMICKDAELARLDRELTDLYAQLLDSPVRDQKRLKVEQRGWIKSRNDCWKSSDQRGCIAESYRDRIDELEIADKWPLKNTRVLASSAPTKAEAPSSIKNIQRALAQAGYDPGPADGHMGAKTGEAIRRFQEDNGLAVDGEPSPALLTVLESVRARSGGSGHPSAEDAVARVPSPASVEDAALILEMNPNHRRLSPASQALSRLVLAQFGARERMKKPETAQGYAFAMDLKDEAEPFFNAHGGWRAENEFDRALLQEKFFAQLVEPQLARAPALPLDLALVYKFRLEEYDAEQGGYPIRPAGDVGYNKLSNRKYFGGHYHIPGGALINFETWVEPPTFLAVASAEAQQLLKQTQSRLIYLKLDTRLTELQPDEIRDAKGPLDITGQTFFADEGLTHPIQLPEGPSAPKAEVAQTAQEVMRLNLGFFWGRDSHSTATPLRKAMTLMGLKLDGEGQGLSNVELATNFTRTFGSDKTLARYFENHWQWKGHNEFEMGNTRQAFQKEVVEPLLGKASSLPFEMDLVYAMRLGSYDAARGGFPMEFAPGGSDRDYVEQMELGFFGWQQVTLNIPGKQPEFLPVPKQEAESLLASLRDRIVFLHAGVSLERYRARPWSFEGRIDRLAVYGDEALTRTIATLETENLPVAMVHGELPDKVDPARAVDLTEDTLALALLRTHPELLTDRSWEFLVRIRMQKEQELYKEIASWFEKDPWPPFFTMNHPQPNADEIARFGRWTEARANGLPNRVTLRDDIKNSRLFEAGIAQPIFPSADHSMRQRVNGNADPVLDGALVTLQLPAGRLHLSRPCYVDHVALAFPADARALMLTFQREELQGESAHLAIDMELELGAVRIIDDSREKCGIVIDARPIAVEAHSRGRFIKRVAIGDAERRAAVAAIEGRARAREAEEASQEAARRNARETALEAARGRFDILGIQLGMPIAEADRIARAHLGESVAVFTDPQELQPPTVEPKAVLRHGTLYINPVTGESIGVYSGSADDGIVIAVFRHMRYGDDEIIPGATVVNALNQKYGAPDAIMAMGWSFGWSPVEEDHEHCVNAVSLLGMHRWTAASGKADTMLLRGSQPPFNLPGIGSLDEDCGVSLHARIFTGGQHRPSDPVKDLSVILVDAPRAIEIGHSEAEKAKEKAEAAFDLKL